MVDQGSSEGWHPDPQRRFELRYHDGSTWTEHVASGGQHLVDPAGVGYLSPSAVGSAGGLYLGTGSPERPRLVGQNTVGAGLATAAVGWLVMFGATFLPWIDDEALWALVTSSGSGSVPETELVSGLQGQVAVSLVWMILVIVGTTLPYQPGKVVGFLMAGCIGLIVCWRKLDAHAQSIRSNLLGVFVVLLHGASIAFALVRVTDDAPGYVDGDVGTGPWVLGAGLALVALGALIGRRYHRVAV
jgi:hypothetical protein